MDIYKLPSIEQIYDLKHDDFAKILLKYKILLKEKENEEGENDDKDNDFGGGGGGPGRHTRNSS